MSRNRTWIDLVVRQIDHLDEIGRSIERVSRQWRRRRRRRSLSMFDVLVGDIRNHRQCTSASLASVLFVVDATCFGVSLVSQHDAHSLFVVGSFPIHVVSTHQFWYRLSFDETTTDKHRSTNVGLLTVYILDSSVSHRSVRRISLSFALLDSHLLSLHVCRSSSSGMVVLRVLVRSIVGQNDQSSLHGNRWQSTGED